MKGIMLFVAIQSFVLVQAQRIQVRLMEPPMPFPQEVFEFQDKALSGIEMGDINGNGLADIVAFDGSSSGKLSLFLNDGKGNYYQKSTSNLPKGIIREKILIDINGDDVMDLVLFHGGLPTPPLHLESFINDGNGNFTLHQKIPLDSIYSGIYKVKLIANDFDSDGDVDFVMIDNSGNQQTLPYVVYWNNRGNFTPIVIYGSQLVYSHGLSADVNNDGLPDIISNGYSASFMLSILVYLNKGNGIFIEEHDPAFFDFQSTKTIDVVDINGDGNNELVILDNSSISPNVLNVDTNGQVMVSQNNTLPRLDIGQTRFADLDNDGDMDLIIAGDIDTGSVSKNPQFMILENNGMGVFSLDTAVGYYPEAEAIHCEDINGDGNLEIIFFKKSRGNTDSYHSFILKNINDKWVQVRSNYFGDYWGSGLEAGDLNNDGVVDLVAYGRHFSTGVNLPAAPLDTSIFILMEKAGYVNSVPNLPFKYLNRGVVRAGDFDNDGDLDLFVMGSQPVGYTARVWENVNDSTFVNIRNMMGAEGGDAVLDDFDGNGYLDIIYADDMGSRILYYLNNGNRTFTIMTSNFNLVWNPCLASGDFNADGAADVLMGGSVVGTSADVNFLYLNDGQGNFQIARTDTFNRSADVFAVGDFNNDSIDDYIIFTTGGTVPHNAVLYLNDTMGGYSSIPLSTLQGVDVENVGVADFDNDGRLDIIVQASRGSAGRDKSVSIFMNDSTGLFTMYDDGGVIRQGRVGDMAVVEHDSSVTDFFVSQTEPVSLLKYRVMTCPNTLVRDTIESCVSYLLPYTKRRVYSSGLYRDTLRSLFTCDSVYEVDLTIKPVDTGVVINGNTLIANATMATSFQWLDCDDDFSAIAGANGSIFTPSEAGYYAVRITQDGCVDTTKCFGVGIMGGEEQGFEVTQASVYPNPTRSNFIVDLGGENHDYEVLRVHNSTGLIFREIAVSDKEQVALKTNSSSGVYYVTLIKSNGEKATFKLLKR